MLSFFKSTPTKEIIESTWNYVKFTDIVPVLVTQLHEQVAKRFQFMKTKITEAISLSNAQRAGQKQLIEKKPLYNNMLLVWLDMELLSTLVSRRVLTVVADVKRLGKGGYGEVRLGTMNENPVAIKILESSFASTVRVVFSQEVYMLKYAQTIHSHCF